MTWNVHRGRGRDGRVDLERVAGVIRGENVDVVALQELDQGRERTNHEDQAMKLGRLLQMHVHFSPTVVDENGGCYGHALFSKTKPKSAEIISLPQVPWREQRTLIELEIVHAGTSVCVQSTHLGLLMPERLLQARSILERQSDLPKVLMGDFNASSWMPTVQCLRRSFRDANSGGSATWPSVFPLRRLDYVFISGSVSCRESRVVAGGNASMASDHLGVSATLCLSS